MLRSTLLLALGLTGALAQYKNRYVYSDYQCTNLIAIKSEPLMRQDDHEEQNNNNNNNGNSYSQAQEEYYKCLEEVQPEEDLDGSNSGVIEDVCEYFEDEEGFGGQMVYGRSGCSWEVETISNATDSVMIAQYEGGCPSRGGQVETYTSMPQQCIPYAVGKEERRDLVRRVLAGNNNNNKNNNNKNNNNNNDHDDKDDERYENMVWYYYSLSCNENRQMSSMTCMYSNCTGCIMTKTYKEGECYNIPSFEGEEDGAYAQFWCNNTVAAAAEYGDEDEDESSDSSMMELPKSTVIAVASVGGALILGLGAALISKNSGESSDALGPLTSSPDYERLQNN